MEKVGLFFGGPSNEHEVSISSAKNIVKHFDYRRYSLVLIYWDKQGNFYEVKDISNLDGQGHQISLEMFKGMIDVALPMTHGKNGEDGVLQSLFESQRIPYCGCHRLSSALCMDKGLFKAYLAGQGIRQANFEILDFNLDSDNELKKKISAIKDSFVFPLYVKPANSGSSVGITRVMETGSLEAAIIVAREHDARVVIEEGFDHPREIEVAALGNKEIIISVPGELKPSQEFYSYDDKYTLGEAQTIVPADLEAVYQQEIMALAYKAYRLCGCSGFARIDFFISGGKAYLNEINTLPGFTDISMYPMLMMATGLSYQELINKIIKLAY